MPNRFFRCITTALLLAVATVAVQAYPDKPITIIVPFNAGTTNDIQARDMAQILSAVGKQNVVVDNRVGAEGTIGAMAMLNLPADGHTLMFSSNSLTVFDPVMKKSMPYDPVKDIAPVCSTGRTANLVNVTGSGPYKNVADVVAAAKANPGKLTFAYTSSSMRLAGELFQQVTGTKMTSVPYKSSVTGLTDVSSGEVDLIFIDRLSALPFYESGKVRPIAAPGSKRLKNMPQVPSADEAGAPGYSMLPWFALYASGKTPPAVLAQVRELVGRAIKTPEAAANLERRGLEAFELCGEVLDKHRLEEMELYRGVIKKAGIELQ